jgi:hypothetical protein
MIDVFNFANPQTANYQEFYGGGSTNTSLSRSWSKPRGASMVRMLLIGAGGGGRSGTTGAGGAGGGSGAVTEWIGPAIFIPDQLRIVPGRGGSPDNTGIDTTIIFQQKDGTGYTLLTASAGSASGGSASSNNFFGASGIFNSIAGQAGASVGTAISASTTTFLSGGSGGSSTIGGGGGNVAAKYGYPTVNGGTGSGGNGGDGYFITQPLFLGVGGAGGGGSATAAGGNGGKGGIGCGGGGGGDCTTGSSLGGRGGDGAVFIWSW